MNPTSGKMLNKCQTITGFTDERHEADDDPSLPPPCVHSKRRRVYVRNVPMCACCRHTWRRFECTHTRFQRATPHRTHTHTHTTTTTTATTTHTTDHTTDTTFTPTQHNTHTTSHGERRQRKKREREREGERKREKVVFLFFWFFEFFLFLLVQVFDYRYRFRGFQNYFEYRYRFGLRWIFLKQIQILTIPELIL